MPTAAPHTDTGNILLWLAVGFFAWYFYQIASRKKKALAYSLRQLVVMAIVYFAVTILLLQQGRSLLEALVLGWFTGVGAAWLLVKRPNRDRRISKAMRQQVIARDLTSKGLKWDPRKYHIDHTVPFSRGGDNSLKNLRVLEKEKNLRKSGKMPGFRDFLR